MYTDEFRDPQQLKQLRIAETVSDPEGVYAKLQKLEGKAYKKEITRLEGERVDLKRRISDAHRVIKELKQQNSLLKNEQELAADRLEKLRKSRTMQVGRSVTSPARLARKFANNPRAASVETAREFNKQWGKIRASLKSKAKTKLESSDKQQKALESQKTADTQKVEQKPAGQKKASGSATQPKPAAPVQQTNEKGGRLSPLEIFKKNPETKNFEKALNFLWFTLGEIERTKQLIEENPKFVAELDDVPQSLAYRVLGEARILQAQIVPERSQFPAYVAEPNRVMYCVHQSPVFNSNGYSTRTRGVANGLKAAGGDVVVVARSGYPWDSQSDVAKPKSMRHQSQLDEVQYIHIPGGNLNREPIDQYVMQAADAFVREARILRPSVIQAASNYRTALPALVAARRLGIPFVYEVRGLWEFTEASAKPGFENTERFDSMRTLETLVASSADQVLAITSQVKEELVSRGIDAERITVAPNSVDPEVFVPLPKDKDFAKSKKINVDVPVIGFAGSIVGYEGLDQLVAASSILQKRGVAHQVVIAGSGAAEAGLKEQAKNLKLGENIRFLGRLPQKQMPRLQSTFDIVACPRKSNLVTELVSPLKPLESFAAGKATVLSSVAPNKDLAGESEERALLCDADSAESLAAQLEKLISDQELLADMGRTSRLWVVRERTWKKLGDRMLDAHTTATQVYESQTPTSRPLSALRVGVIGDEFTRSTLEDSFNVELLGRNSWSEQLNTEPKFDMIFVESAWEGNEGDWHRAVGHYSDEESADLRGLLELAREKEIPTVFWNKEDPIHISRFAPNAALFDHVFTTDANMIPRYMKTEGCRNITVSALPFYAQPKLHNPLPVERKYRDSIAYAGSYYGDRYKERSQGLERLLLASSKYPMDIYDRQANNPDSPYKFPEAYRGSVRGGLPYKEVVQSYKSHIAHLNVNSVLNSPTMFSRRVVEIPACGGIVLSAYGRGISETLGSNIANSNNLSDYRAWLYEWTSNPSGRLNEIWRQMRTVYRSHTTDSALAILARTAGLSVRGLNPPTYAAHLPSTNGSGEAQRMDWIYAIANQSIRPQEIVISDLSEQEEQLIHGFGIRALSQAEVDSTGEYQIFFPEQFSRTFAEDVLLPFRFGEFSSIQLAPSESYKPGSTLVTPVDNLNDEFDTVVISSRSQGRFAVVTLPEQRGSVDDNSESDELEVSLKGKTVLVAGHDLKFAGGILDELETAGCEVLIDKWDGHNQHDEEQSSELLKNADLVICEWGLGNAVWYSQHVRTDQPVIVRVHSQELFLPYLKKINKAAVSKFVFVGELIRKAAIESHQIPAEKSLVIPNFVDTNSLAKPKTAEADKTIGFVGIVPRSKRLDRALDVLEGLLEKDSGYKLRIKGKTPEDYPWMKNRPEELRFYEEQYQRIDRINEKYPNAVVFDGFGPDMEDWYSKVGIVLSTSDFESFHLTIADGAASGAVPALLNWPGADLIYPDFWLSGSIDRLVNSILNEHVKSEDAQRYIREKFSAGKQLKTFFELLRER